MDRLLWNAARRVAVLVGCGLAVIGALLVGDTITGHGTAVADVSGIAAASLAAAALVGLLRARGFFARSEEPPSVPTSPYRDNALTTAGDPFGPDCIRATRSASWAFIALSLAAAFEVVAAASR